MSGSVSIKRNCGKFLAFAAAAATAVAPILFSLAYATPSRAQTQAAPPATVKFEYEVASFKPNKSSFTGGPILIGISYPPDGLSASNASVQMLIQQAYGIQAYQLSGGPDWLNNERFDVDAKMDPAVADALAKLSQDERTATRQLMLQALLADRLKLTVRRDTKDLPVYTLSIGKNGLKMKEAKPPDPNATNPTAPPPPANGGRFPVTVGGGGGGNVGVRGGPGTVVSFGGRGGERSFNGNALPMPALVRMLSGAVGRPVLDRTGLTARYDFTLKWVPEDSPSFGGPGGGPDGTLPAAPPDASGPSIFTAVQEQLGLKLDAGKGPVLMIVIEHVEKPSDN